MCPAWHTLCASSGDHSLPNTLYFLRITYTTRARGRYNGDAASLKMSRSRCLQLLRRCMDTDNIIRKHAQPLHDATRGVQAHREPLLFTTLLYNIQPVPCGEPQRRRHCQAQTLLAPLVLPTARGRGDRLPFQFALPLERDSCRVRFGHMPLHDH